MREKTQKDTWNYPDPRRDHKGGGGRGKESHPSSDVHTSGGAGQVFFFPPGCGGGGKVGMSRSGGGASNTEMDILHPLNKSLSLGAGAHPTFRLGLDGGSVSLSVFLGTEVSGRFSIKETAKNPLEEATQ